jgi:hypothetical protein
MRLYVWGCMGFMRACVLAARWWCGLIAMQTQPSTVLDCMLREQQESGTKKKLDVKSLFEDNDADESSGIFKTAGKGSGADAAKKGGRLFGEPEESKVAVIGGAKAKSKAAELFGGGEAEEEDEDVLGLQVCVWSGGVGCGSDRCDDFLV